MLPPALTDLMLEYPGFADLARFKARLSAELVAGYRQTLNDAGASHMALVPNLFPWPWSLASGAGTYRQIATHSAALAVKLYGMHWKMMIRFYADQLQAANPSLDSRLLVRALLSLLDIMDEPASDNPSDYGYPAPDEPHGVGVGAQQRKIRVAREYAEDTPVMALAHGYGPVDDLRARLIAVRDSQPEGIWINRYGYLSDAKLEVVGDVFK